MHHDGFGQLCSVLVSVPRQMIFPYKLATNCPTRTHRSCCGVGYRHGVEQRGARVHGEHAAVGLRTSASHRSSAAAKPGLRPIEQRTRSRHHTMDCTTVRCATAARLQHATCNTRRCNVQHAAMQHANTRRCNAPTRAYALCNMRHAPMQHANAHLCSTQRGNMQHGTRTNATRIDATC
jgi:hypothetical protein